MKNHPPRPFALVLIAQLLLAACSATAHSPPPGQWPEPKPTPWPEPMPFPTPIVRTVPNFQAPSATHCARPVQTRELPGRVAGDQIRGGHHEHRDRLAKSAPAELSDSARSGPPSMFPSPQPQVQQPPSTGPVTAGMVDDNADFSGYLAFRNRTRVEHRTRDIRERYLLEVKDPRGRGVADAEVAVQATSGHAMWARTDAAGRAWLHPNAFDPSRSSYYAVAVRKDGRQSWAQLTRGQKSSVEVVLDARPAEARAKLDLVFLIDATGSMADEIDKLKATLRSISAEVSRLPSQPDICFGLVAYRDKGDEFLLRSHDFTNDVGDFLQNALYPLRAAAGGDYPEAMNEAFHDTVHNLSWRGEGATRLVVLLADAPPHLDYGGPHYDEDMLAALGKGIKVFSVGASGLDKQGELIQRQIAQYTGGRFVFLTYAQAHDPASGPGRETVHDVKNYSVDTLDRLIVRLVSEELGKLAR
ncbi:VWA domain-containing protein [Caenimonas soli]|uniref:VWA domain-containing protein n=1 Tax=Caenimonas soli TaxID=2735555 RepID=UPI001553C18D|nr:VWA domain-containing protein [Caenimonas soli]NPC58891.1 VWA domain-containing protein [Caenimonas soli]